MNKLIHYLKITMFFRRYIALSLLLILSIWIQGCTAIVGAHTDGPIQMNYGKRL